MVPHHGSVRIAEFALERYFARWEFAAEHLLCASDVEGYPMAELLALADDETRALWDGLRLGYTESTGHPLLRAEIASLYETIEPDDVLTFAGAEEAVFCLMNVVVGPGDHAIVTWPGYQSLYEVARANGADVTLHELRELDGWRSTSTSCGARSRPRPGSSSSTRRTTRPGCCPTAPPTTGWWRSPPRPARISSLDEVYRGLEFDEADRLPAGADALPTGISLGVMSKAYAMAGLRIGWLASPDRDLLARVAAFKDYTTICSSGPSEILAIIALRARERVLARSRGIIAANLDRLDAFFEAWPDRFAWVRPRAGSIGFPRLTVPGVRIDDWAAELVAAEGVLLLPGSQFGYPGNHFRLGFGRTDLPEGLDRLEAYAGRTLR